MSISNGNGSTAPAERQSGAARPTPARPALPDTVTMQQLADMLRDRGVQIAYSSLSEMIGQGDIAEQLKAAKGERNARAFPLAAVDVLAAFIPQYREARGKLPQAPALLRSMLSQRGGTEISVFSESPISENGRSTGNGITRFSESPINAVAIAEAQGRADGLAQRDCVMDATTAAGFLGISVRLLRKSAPPWRRFGSSPRGDRWLLSQLLSS